MTAAPPLLVIAGATATGKTSLAIEVAEAIRAGGRVAEIISADSRQVFRGMDIGTAKATAAERARVPHHGLDLVDPDEPFSVADFARHAAGVLDDLASRGGVAILAGGTGFYLRAVARGLDTEALPSDPEVRARLEAALAHDGLLASVLRLEALAPELPPPSTCGIPGAWSARWRSPSCAGTRRARRRVATRGRWPGSGSGWSRTCTGADRRPGEGAVRCRPPGGSQGASRALRSRPAGVQRDRLSRGVVGSRRD